MSDEKAIGPDGLAEFVSHFCHLGRAPTDPDTLSHTLLLPRPGINVVSGDILANKFVPRNTTAGFHTDKQTNTDYAAAKERLVWGWFEITYAPIPPPPP